MPWLRREVEPLRRPAFLGVLAALAFALVHELAAAPPFPTPDRPVAPIITPAYSDERTRDERGEAARVLDRLDVRSGMRVADIGAGDGYYTVRLARRGAVVWAEDIKAEYLDRLRTRLARERIAGVTVVHGTSGDPKLPAARIDLAILAHVYHEVENPYELFYRLRPALAPGARVAIVDNDKPTQEHGTPPALLRCEMAALGYRPVDFLPLAPADGYLAVFTPPAVLPPIETIRRCVR